jgi:hypothetical protein
MPVTMAINAAAAPTAAIDISAVAPRRRRRARTSDTIGAAIGGW